MQKIAGNVRAMVTLVSAFVRDLASRVKVAFSGVGGDLAIIGRAWLKLQSVVTTVIVEVAKRVLPILSGPRRRAEGRARRRWRRSRRSARGSGSASAVRPAAGRDHQSSGNVSYHSSGEALDISGSREDGDARASSTLPQEHGRRPARRADLHARRRRDQERPAVHVHGPGRRRPLRPRPRRLRQRRPGVGDGLGQFDATSYGPPWGGIQGTGVTATGVNLKGSPHMYGVAVDPNVIPLGSKLKISPNPFGYSGTFTAFDTGGAIKGHRIDFYDWRGRRSRTAGATGMCRSRPSAVAPRVAAGRASRRLRR
jgi:3D (Asp-Asp-Asp) domain-containing protein